MLIGAAGFLSVFTWILHGHVFANAQTGNIVQFIATAFQGDWGQASRHVAPMLAFFPGVFAAQWLLLHWPATGVRNAAVVVLSIEIVILVAIAVLPATFPESPVTFGISFVAALQNSAFKQTGQWSYTSVVTTGNLRSAGEAIYAALAQPSRLANQKARVFVAFCVAFVVGSALGAFLTIKVGPNAIAVPIALLMSVLLCRLCDRQIH